MVMAGPPSTVKQRSLSPKDEKIHEAISDALADGNTIGQVAKRLSRGDKQRYHYWYNRIRRMVRKDALFQARVQEALKGEALLGSPQAVHAAIARASRGRMDAVRFVLAMSGMYNEKVQHEHSGDVAITLKIARPEPVVDHTKRMDLEEGIVDADVVEDDPGT